MRHILLSLPIVFSIGSAAVAQETGPLPETFSATYVAAGPGCIGLLLTGQFLAATPGYTIVLSASDPQANAPTTYSLDMTATPPSGTVTQVLTPMPVVYEDVEFDQCPYGITITYEDETFIVPFSPLS